MVVPAVTSQLIVLIYNMADTFYVGQTNNPYMVASTSLILPVFNITLCLAGLAGIGGGALISRLLGQDVVVEGDGVAGLVPPEHILNVLGAGANTYTYARQYAMCVIVVGGIPTVLSNVLANLIEALGAPGRRGWASFWAAY